MRARRRVSFALARRIVMIRMKHLLWVLAFGLMIPFAALANQTPQSATSPAAYGKRAAKAHSALRINLNTATKEELMSLPGVNDETAAKIIAARPFKSKDQLVQKNLITKDEYKKITSLITTAHMRAAATKK
jgi:competence protein ComEA